MKFADCFAQYNEKIRNNDQSIPSYKTKPVKVDTISLKYVFAQEVISHGHVSMESNLDILHLLLIKYGWASWLLKTMERTNILNKYAEMIF